MANTETVSRRKKQTIDTGWPNKCIKKKVLGLKNPKTPRSKLVVPTRKKINIRKPHFKL
jgi:hypothetical protein